MNMDGTPFARLKLERLHLVGSTREEAASLTTIISDVVL
jgi:hypothetical protein